MGAKGRLSVDCQAASTRIERLQGSDRGAVTEPGPGGMTAAGLAGALEKSPPSRTMGVD